jgi:hypothetical protein
MRRAVLLVFAVLVVAGVASAAVGAAARPQVEESREPEAAPVAVQRVNIPATGIRDEAAMVLVGSALIGLAAAVRRAA